MLFTFNFIFVLKKNANLFWEVYIVWSNRSIMQFTCICCTYLIHMIFESLKKKITC